MRSLASCGAALIARLVELSARCTLWREGMARPTGGGPGTATCHMPIEGRDEWLAAARRLA
jgi:hypothetical protein